MGNFGVLMKEELGLQIGGLKLSYWTPIVNDRLGGVSRRQCQQ